MLGTSCPFCAGLKVCDCNNLTSDPKNSDLLKEWHTEKNAKSPSQYTEYSHEKVWWKCLNELSHPDWETTIYHRMRGYGKCKSCHTNKSAGARVCCDVLQTFVKNSDLYEEKGIPGCEYQRPLLFDFIVQEPGKRKIAIEFDGGQHFAGAFFAGFFVVRRRDLIKNRFCRLNGIHMLRISFSRQRHIPEIISQFLEAVKKCGGDEVLQVYDGKEYDTEYRTESEKNN